MTPMCIQGRRRVRSGPPKLDWAILSAYLSRKEYFLTPDIKCRQKKGVVKRASKHLTAKLTKLHRRRALQQTRFRDTRKKIGDTLKPPTAVNRRARHKTIKRIVEYKLLRRNTLQTLYHVSLSSLHNISFSENGVDAELHSPAQQIHTTSRSHPCTRVPPPIVPLEPAAYNHQSSLLSLDRSPWLIPPWCTDFSVNLNLPCRIQLSFRLPLDRTCFSSQRFLDRVPWLIPPWLARIFSVSPPWLVPPVPDVTVLLLCLSFLQQRPWMIPPWVPFLK